MKSFDNFTELFTASAGGSQPWDSELKVARAPEPRIGLLTDYQVRLEKALNIIDTRYHMYVFYRGTRYLYT